MALGGWLVSGRFVLFDYPLAALALVKKSRLSLGGRVFPKSAESGTLGKNAPKCSRLLSWPVKRASKLAHSSKPLAFFYGEKEEGAGRESYMYVYIMYEYCGTMVPSRARNTKRTPKRRAHTAARPRSPGTATRSGHKTMLTGTYYM